MRGETAMTADILDISQPRQEAHTVEIQAVADRAGVEFLGGGEIKKGSGG